MGTGLRGHEKYDAAYVLSRRPAFIVLPSGEALMAFVGWASGADFARKFPGLPALEDMYANPQFRAQYAPAEFGTFRRRDHQGEVYGGADLELRDSQPCTSTMASALGPPLSSNQPPPSWTRVTRRRY